MSEVINPPDYYFTGINFNPAFYAQDAVSGLSEETANGLYLRKTVADTATALETFNSGIKSLKMDGLLTSSIMYVGNNITTGSLILGNTPIRTKNQGIFETASIRAPATNGTVAICGDATAGGGVDIGTSVSTTNLYGTSKTNTIDALGGATATMNLASSITSGTINFMTNTVVSGIFNLMYNAVSNATGTINIGQYNTSPSPTKTTTNIRGDVNIGSSATTTTVYGTLNIPTSGGASSNAVNVAYLTTALANVATLNQVQIFTGTNTFNNNSVTFGRPLTISYSYPIASNTQFGYKEQPTITWTASANTVIGTSTSLPVGNYSMTFNMTNTGAYIPNYVSFGGTAGGVLANFRVPWVLSDSSFSLVNGAYLFTITTAGTITLVNRAANSQSGGDSNWTIIRIS